MIAIITALALQSGTTDAQLASVRAYQECLAPIVMANELADEAAYAPRGTVLLRIRTECSSQRAAAREALIAYVVARHPDLPGQPTDADKEELIHEATVRWANGIAHQMVAETHD